MTPTIAEARPGASQAGAPAQPHPGMPSVLHALADPTRWSIVQHLAAAELCTTHLQELLNSKQPVMSHHLKVLRDAGLVQTRPCGRYTYYRLRPGALDAAVAALAGLQAASRVAPLESRPC